MRGLIEVFLLELRSLVRSKTLVLLLAASVGWMLAFPLLVRGDGTAEGARELYIHYSLGGVFLLLVIALLSSAAGSLARERETKRLQLTVVRPVRFFAVVVGKIAAHVVIGALVLFAAALVLALKTDLSAPCYHVLSPDLPSPREEAKAMYEAYMKDPGTPEAVKKAKKSVVLRLLENRAVDNYQVIPTNVLTTWKFRMPDDLDSADRKVRMRFAAQYDTRQDVRGWFRLGALYAPVSNITQAVVSVPLKMTQAGAPAEELTFFNSGKDALMLRPRKDLNVLVAADGFGWNLLRACFGLLAILTLLVAFGTFLSAGLGRPVALFVAFVLLAVGEMSPSVVEQYPNELDANLSDRIGLTITRFATEVTRPLSAASPIEALANDECVELGSLVRLAFLDTAAFTLVLVLLAAFVLPRKPA